MWVAFVVLKVSGVFCTRNDVSDGFFKATLRYQGVLCYGPDSVLDDFGCLGCRAIRFFDDGSQTKSCKPPLSRSKLGWRIGWTLMSTLIQNTDCRILYFPDAAWPD